MNAAHLHLLVNHVSIFGVTFGIAALVWSLVRNSREMLWASIGLFLISGIFAWIAVETGEGAEELIEHLPFVTKSIIKPHEEAAELAQVFTLILAGDALLLAAVARFKNQWLKAGQLILLGLAIVSGGLLARCANLGGEIRHTEIRSSGVVEQQR